MVEGGFDSRSNWAKSLGVLAPSYVIRLYFLISFRSEGK